MHSAGQQICPLDAMCILLPVVTGRIMGFILLYYAIVGSYSYLSAIQPIRRLYGEIHYTSP